MDTIAVPGKLKLKKGGVVKKPKVTTADKAKVQEAVKHTVKTHVSETNTGGPASSDPSVALPAVVHEIKKTKAELMFEKRRLDMQTERVLKKAEKSHKDRVADFNKYLDNLTEINDIPKVSWTK